MIKKTVIILCLLLSFCHDVKEDDNSMLNNLEEENNSTLNKNKDSVKEWINLKRIFIKRENLNLSDSSRKEILQIINNKTSKKFCKIDSNFVKRNICVYSNTCFGKSYEIDYIPISYFVLPNYPILVVEIYKNKFPIWFKEAIALTYDTLNNVVMDKIRIYHNDDFGINDEEISSKISGNKIKLTYYNRESFDPSNESEKDLQLFKITHETYIVNKEGMFEIIDQNAIEKFYDDYKMKWLK
jgi:hypothetical protein